MTKDASLVMTMVMSWDSEMKSLSRSAEHHIADNGTNRAFTTPEKMRGMGNDFQRALKWYRFWQNELKLDIAREGGVE